MHTNTIDSVALELTGAWIENDILYFQGFVDQKTTTLIVGRVGDKDEDGWETTPMELETILLYANVMIEETSKKANLTV